jgi:hypothetical protein
MKAEEARKQDQQKERQHHGHDSGVGNDHHGHNSGGGNDAASGRGGGCGGSHGGGSDGGGCGGSGPGCDCHASKPVSQKKPGRIGEEGVMAYSRNYHRNQPKTVQGFCAKNLGKLMANINYKINNGSM